MVHYFKEQMPVIHILLAFIQEYNYFETKYIITERYLYAKQ